MNLNALSLVGSCSLNILTRCRIQSVPLVRDLGQNKSTYHSLVNLQLERFLGYDNNDKGHRSKMTASLPLSSPTLFSLPCTYVASGSTRVVLRGSYKDVCQHCPHSPPTEERDKDSPSHVEIQNQKGSKTGP